MNGHELISYLFGGFIISVAVVAAVYHYRRWKQVATHWKANAPMELVFELRQQRRRLQLACLGGLGGFALTLAGFALPRWPYWGVWLVVLAIVMIVWTLLLAIGDMMSIQAYYRIMERKHEAEQTRFTEEFRRRSAGREESREPADSSDKP